MQEKDHETIEKKIGYVFNRKDLLDQAFVRRSYSQENDVENNEVLEFYGDKVLEFIVGKLFAEHFGSLRSIDKENNPYYPYEVTISTPIYTPPKKEYISDYDEGELTELRKTLVSRNNLSQKIYDMDLEGYLYLGKGEIKNNVQENDSVKEDLFEAILGAIAIDSEWDIKRMQNAVEVMLDTEEFFSGKSYVRKVTEWSIDEYGYTPDYYIYSYLNCTIPLKPNTIIDKSIQGHRKICKHYCNLNLRGYEFWAGGDSQREAKYNAFKLVYEYLEDEGLLNPLKNEIDEPSEDMAINNLETLARRGYFDLPKYKFTETHDKNGNPVWQTTCMIDDFDKVLNATSSSKKESKKKAAFKMLEYIIENYYDEED